MENGVFVYYNDLVTGELYYFYPSYTNMISRVRFLKHSGRNHLFEFYDGSTINLSSNNYIIYGILDVITEWRFDYRTLLE